MRADYLYGNDKYLLMKVLKQKENIRMHIIVKSIIILILKGEIME